MDGVRPASRRRILVTVAGGNFVQLGARLLIGAVVPLLLVYFDTSRSAIGLALTGMWAIYALMQFPSGVLADRYGERALILLSLAGATVGILFVAFSTSVVLFAVFILALGAGAGLFFAPGSILITRLYAGKGGALGVMTASGAVAGVVFPVVAGFVGVGYGWRVAVGVGAIGMVIILLASVVTIPSTTPKHPNGSVTTIVDFPRQWRLLTQPSIAYSIVVGIMTGFTYQAIASFFPTFLVEYHQLDAGAAGVAFGFVFALSAAAQPVVGHLSDRYTRDVGIAISVITSMAGLGILLVAPRAIALVVGLVFLGLGVSWAAPVTARFFDHLPDDERGYGFGLVRTVYLVIASSGSVVVGVLADLSGWLAGMGSLLVVLGMCLLLIGINRMFSLEL